ncbi:MAG: hypothetical protein JW747_05760 [Candidatus Aminicenantes bacterium]|nr:hypothetical protein [Candidatus Aminicenantes bacterium]
MPDCRTRKALIGLVPLASLRRALLARHLSRCARCREREADIREARSVTWAKEDFEGRPDFWPRLEEALRRPDAPHTAAPRLAPRWRWAAVSAAAVGLAAAGLILIDFEKKNGPVVAPGLKLVIDSPRIYSEPAQAYIFQTQDEHTTFVWVEKQPQGEEL